MTGLEQLVVLAAGLGAGILTSTVGVASLLSFPVLVAVGLPPVVANASNTLGLTPGALSGSYGYRRELREQPRTAGAVLLTCGLGAVAGAFLLLSLPAGFFEAVVGWLILFTCLLVGVQPRISGWVRARHVERAGTPLRREVPSPATRAFLGLTGVYGGYFGAGSGVLALAVLGFGVDLELRVLNALKTLAVMAGNVVASVVFILVADLDWTAVGLLSLGSVVGGYLGAHLGRHLPPSLLRAAIVVGGMGAGVVLILS